MDIKQFKGLILTIQNISRKTVSKAKNGQAFLKPKRKFWTLNFLFATKNISQPWWPSQLERYSQIEVESHSKPRQTNKQFSPKDYKDKVLK